MVINVMDSLFYKIMIFTSNELILSSIIYVFTQQVNCSVFNLQIKLFFLLYSISVKGIFGPF